MAGPIGVDDAATPADVRMPRRPWRRIAAEIDLPVATAVWVLAAHVATILAPLVLVPVVLDHFDQLSTVLDRPGLLIASAVLFVVASIAESAQNTLDRWYLTGTPPSLLDWVFTTCVAAGIAAQVLAVAGDAAWVSAVAIVAVVALATAYLLGWPFAPLQAFLGLWSALLLFQALDQSVAFVPLLTTFLTLFCLDVLLRTRQQVMHGFTTLANAFAPVSLAAAIVWFVDGGGAGWSLFAVLAVVVVAVPFVLRPWLLRLPATPRREQDATDSAASAEHRTHARQRSSTA